ncbi:MAG: tyrosine--tRNA ligase [Thermoanaerobaculia bacterium]
MASTDDSERTYALLTKGATHLVDEADLRRKLARAKKENRPLTVKVGFDPSAPDIHLGHAVLLMKMRHFQDAGHRVIFLIGDFTGLIGDPSGKKSTRPQLTRPEIERNAESYAAQCFKVLDPEKTEIRYNSEWFLGGGAENRPALGADGFVRLASKITVARVLERDDFARRWAAHHPISLHELMYPLSQGYDSVALKADVELGGTDQLFNLLLGRDLMREEGMEPQVVMTVPLLVGTDGVEKMSKSLGNAIGVNDSPADMFGKIMSISDETMWSYATLLTGETPDEIEKRKRDVAAGRLHPMDAKKSLAREIVSRFHGAEAAEKAQEEFTRVFSRHQLPEKIERMTIPVEIHPGNRRVPVAWLVFTAGMAKSIREAGRSIDAGAVSLDGLKIETANPHYEFPEGALESEILLRVGKRGFMKLTLRRSE